MKQLNRKVFVTIFSILSIFVLIGVIIYNFQSYKREYDSISRNLNFINEFRPNPIDSNIKRPDKKDIGNMMIMDYEVYTVLLNDNEVDKIIGHSDTNSNFNIDKAIKQIMSNEKGKKVGNLYLSSYAYNYSDNNIIIVNTSNTSARLTLILIESLLVLVMMEIIIYFAVLF